MDIIIGSFICLISGDVICLKWYFDIESKKAGETITNALHHSLFFMDNKWLIISSIRHYGHCNYQNLLAVFFLLLDSEEGILEVIVRPKKEILRLQKVVGNEWSGRMYPENTEDVIFFKYRIRITGTRRTREQSREEKEKWNWFPEPTMTRAPRS